MQPAGGGQASRGGGASSRPSPNASLTSKGAPEASTYGNGRSSGGGGGSGGLSLPGRRPVATTAHPMPRPSPLAGRIAASASGGMRRFNTAQTPRAAPAAAPAAAAATVTAAAIAAAAVDVRAVAAGVAATAVGAYRTASPDTSERSLAMRRISQQSSTGCCAGSTSSRRDDAELSQERPACWVPGAAALNEALSATGGSPATRPPGTSTYRRPPRGDAGGGPGTTGDRPGAGRSGVRRVAGEEEEGEGGGGGSGARGRTTGGGGASGTSGLGVHSLDVVARPARPLASRPVMEKERPTHGFEDNSHSSLPTVDPEQQQQEQQEQEQEEEYQQQQHQQHQQHYQRQQQQWQQHHHHHQWAVQQEQQGQEQQQEEQQQEERQREEQYMEDQLERSEDEEQQHEENGNADALEAADTVDNDMFQLADAEEDAERNKAKMDQCEALVRQKQEALARFRRDCEAEVERIKAVMEEHVAQLELKLKGEIQVSLDGTVKAKIEHNHRDKSRARKAHQILSSFSAAPLVSKMRRFDWPIHSDTLSSSRCPQRHTFARERTDLFLLSPWDSGCEHGQPSNRSPALRHLDEVVDFRPPAYCTSTNTWVGCQP
ncbi:unnamed protein product [Ectocarpus sp. CCAP 1310/34]|nr:unnamed protein product [Ectocarpus sp. CCAP 1310/34]